MPNRSSKTPPDDPNMAAKAAVDRIIEQTEDEPPKPKKNPAAVALGRLGGKKGGPARAAKLTPEERREIAKRAAQARWATRQQDPENKP